MTKRHNHRGEAVGGFFVLEERTQTVPTVMSNSTTANAQACAKVDHGPEGLCGPAGEHPEDGEDYLPAQ